MIRSFRKTRSVITLGIVFAVITSFAIPSIQASALDVVFYSTNSIFNYDRDACGGGSAGGTGGSKGNLVGNDNYEKGLRYYVGKNLTLAQAAGILGNFKEESGMNPAIIQGGKIADNNYILVDGTGFGIAQWTSGGRQDNLEKFAKEKNKKITDLSMQLDFTWDEINKSYKSTLTALKKETDPEKAAIVFHNGYESSADDAAMLAERSASAKSIYDTYKAKIPDGLASADGSAKNGGECTGDGTASNYVDGFTIYDQNDPKWANVWYGGPESASDPKHGTVASAGCGPSSMAMVITALTKESVTPEDTAIYGRENGTVYNKPDGSAGGSLHNLEIIGKHWNITGTRVSKTVTAINSVLRAGGLVVISGQGSAPFTDSGHFVTIRAINDKGKWLLGDSNGKKGLENSKKEWDPADIVARMGDYHFSFKVTKSVTNPGALKVLE